MIGANESISSASTHRLRESFSAIAVTRSSADLFYKVVDQDSAHVDSNNNLGVAASINFHFSYTSGTIGTLTLTLTNLAGTEKSPGSGTFYTTGVLTGFGFDLPGTVATPDIPKFTYVNSSFHLTATNDPVVNFAPSIPFDETNPQGTFDFGASSTTPQPIDKAIQAGKYATFTMQFSGTAANLAASFNDNNFFKTNGTDADFGFRFQSVGANGSGSDKFVYYEGTPPIPEPSTYGVMAAAGLLGIIGVKRFRGKKSALVS
jgi:hypothetical protein